jgi:hypothetical protein
VAVDGGGPFGMVRMLGVGRLGYQLVLTPNFSDFLIF